jgi:hypothetical protein
VAKDPKPVIHASGYTLAQPREVPGSVFLIKPKRPTAVLAAMTDLGLLGRAGGRL